MPAAEKVDSSVSCPKCGVARPADLAQTIPRPPCPECGAQGIAISVGIASELSLASELQVAIRPKDQTHGWERRWANIQAELQRLLAPRDGTLSGAAVHAAQRELLGFYVRAYHVKDALKVEAPATGVSGPEIEAAVDADPDLALLVDLANVVKHLKLNRPPRSGDEPHIGQVQGSQAASGKGAGVLSK